MNSLAITPGGDTYIKAALKTAGFESYEALALHIMVENPHFHTKSDKVLASLINMPEAAVRALRYDPEWRATISRLLTLQVVDYAKEREHIEELSRLVTQAEKETDRIRAFEVVSRQAGTKLPEQQNINETKRVEVVMKQLGANEHGYKPLTPYQAPVSRRKRLGESSEERNVGAAAGQEGEGAPGEGAEARNSHVPLPKGPRGLYAPDVDVEDETENEAVDAEYYVLEEEE